MDAMDMVNELPGVYPGGAFNAGLPNGKASGSLRAESDQLRLEYEGGHAELPLSGLQAAFGGAANRLIFFKHPEKPDWTFFTADRRILNDSTLNFSYGVAEQLARLRGSRRRSAAFWLVSFGMVVALIVALVLGLLFNRDAMIDAVTRQIPPEVEQALGEQAIKQYKASAKMVDDDDVKDPLLQAAAPLLAIPGNQHEFHIYIVEDSQVNAFALPGGHIALTTGLLLEAESAEEVLGVLAHEMAHSVLRHNMRQLVATAGMGVLLQAFIGDSSALVKLLGGAVEMLANNSYSRDQEREADRVGFSYMRDAGINPKAMLVFMRRQQKKLRDAGVDELEKQLNYLSTHPSFDERVSSLDQWVQETGGNDDFIEVDLDYEVFKAKLRKSMNRP